MGEFWMGVVSSVAASGLLLILGWMTSARMRQKARRALLKTTGAGVLENFSSQRAASRTIAGAVAESRSIRIMAGRGNELTRDTFESLWEVDSRRKAHVKILLPDPDKSGAGSWIDDHQEEAIGYDGGQGEGLIADQIRANVTYVTNMAKNRAHVELALFDFPAIGRLVITEKIAFLTVYSERQHGADSPCVALAAGHPLYDFTVRIFEKIWAASRRP